ncbi:CPBP family intramembrane metalloprotease [Tenacibaculum aiptasiae]|uniref:CPBP family intramembrane metalloprotease n=1 Tax=Tenacibaculum aiptasiae TaxID=426481 RepID=A0A7J5ATD5_9FLAO|nr:CPBP family intramembrane metalloprotease [Tenacibaculum aiptasiae]
MFTLIHIGNIKIIYNIFLIPLLILPQFISGTIMGYLRIKYGFVFSVLFHMLNNFISMVIFKM